MAELISKMRQARSAHQAGHLGEARAQCEDILREAPLCVEAFFLLSLIAAQQGDFVVSLAGYDRLISIEPTMADAYSNRGAALAALNRWEEALTNFDQAISLRPDHAEAHLGRAILWLLHGDFARGWAEYEWRWQTSHGRSLQENRSFSQPRWFGAEDIAGKTILLYSETGLGDSLQFCRFAKAVRDLGATVLLQVQAPLLELLSQLDGVSLVVADTATPPPFDLHCPLLSLPLALKIQLATIPSGRYLAAPPLKVAAWKTQIGGSAKPRIGLVWRGDPRNPDDRKRSVSLAELLPHLPAGFQYWSLQKELTESERALAAAFAGEFKLGKDMNFVETAALCECLDLVISVDTSIAHLSAALGQQTWILVPHNPDCRWLLDRADSPWYSSVKLYRQGATHGWNDVLAEVAENLMRHIAH
jgi:Tetratricopeptide repeat/Glycosyltransferase family 9 (heptosyltransferase)